MQLESTCHRLPACAFTRAASASNRNSPNCLRSLLGSCKALDAVGNCSIVHVVPPAIPHTHCALPDEGPVAQEIARLIRMPAAHTLAVHDGRARPVAVAVVILERRDSTERSVNSRSGLSTKRKIDPVLRRLLKA